MNGMDTACQTYLKEVTRSAKTETGIIDSDTDRRPIGVVKEQCGAMAHSEGTQETVTHWILAETSRSKEETVCDEAVQQIKSMMSENKYKDAIVFGRKERRKLPFSSDPDCSCFLARSELDVYYALVLIYTGATEEGIAMLEGTIIGMTGGQRPEDMIRQGDPLSTEGQRRNLILGLALSHIGYAFWMNLGQYKAALEKFRLALAYFYASKLWEQWANTSDDIGCVYALLHQRAQSEFWLNAGLELRCQLKLDSHIALSLNSLAITHLIFGEAESAQKLSARALAMFGDRGELRGVGLASITLGRALRQLGGANNLAKAAKHLERAVGIFTPQSVHEPVRLIEAQEELGCIYRDLTYLSYKRILNPSLAERFDDSAAQHLVTAITLAKEKYPVLYVDSCFDMAQTCVQSQRFDIAEFWIERAQQAMCARQSDADRHRNLRPQLVNLPEFFEKLPDTVPA